MGFIQKWVAKTTGADQAADATERGAEQQAQAIRDSATKAAQQAQEAAAQTARAQEASAARNAAEGAAADAMARPMENPDVQIGVATGGQSAAGTARRRRAQFGMGGGNSGVNI